MIEIQTILRKREREREIVDSCKYSKELTLIMASPKLKKKSSFAANSGQFKLFIEGHTYFFVRNPKERELLNHMKDSPFPKVQTLLTPLASHNCAGLCVEFHHDPIEKSRTFVYKQGCW